MNNQQIHGFLAVYYIILPLLHVSTRTLSYMRIEFIRFACNSAGTEELHDDDTHVSKHVGAAE
jgi:hypothetical protein